MAIKNTNLSPLLKEGTGIALTSAGQVITITSTGAGALPAGSDTQVQFNDAGVLGADAGLTYNKTLNILGLEAIDFAVTPTAGTAERRLLWDNDEGSLNLTLKGGATNIALGAEVAIMSYNAEATTLNKGEVVYLFGAQGQRPSVKRAVNTSDATSATTFGMVAESIASGATGFVMQMGIVRNIDTNAYNEGDILYLGSTAGSVTTTKPSAPAHMVFVGVVLKKNASSGRIFVKPQNGYELSEIHDIALSSVANNDLLVYESSSTLWKNKSISTVLGYTPEQPLTFSSPLSRSTNTISIPVATSLANGYLSSSDFATFSGKQNALSGTGIVKSTSGTISYISGTSSQFVKGDGSLDSSSYLTGASSVSFSTDVNTIGSQTLGNSISVKVVGLNGTALPTLSTTAGVLKWTGATGTWVLDSNTYLTSAITSLNSLTASSQTFAVGTSGTDFAISSATSTHTFNLPTASATNRGALSSSDWSTFNGKESALTFSSPLSRSTNTISIPVATSLANGYLSSSDWSTFNGKQSAITLTTTGSSGSSTFVSNTLNIPTYTLAGLGGFANPMSTLGDTIYGAASGIATRLAGSTSASKVFLSQTGTGTASAAPAWSAVTKSDVGLGSVENTALSTWAGSTNITTLGTIGTGTWSASTIAVDKGGTGATTLTGVVIGSGTSALTAVAGTASQLLRRNAGNTAYEFFTPTYVTSAITSLGGLTASTQTFANDTNVTITSATSTHTLGWSGQLAVSRGGTGLSALGTANQLIRVNAGATALEYFTPSYLTSAITSLGGLTGATQTFATGTSGTDFNISSATTIHTFNIPTASATNRGLLSTTDWTSFNNKLSTAITSLGGLTASTQTFANDTNVTITSATSTHTLGWTGQLSVGRGGTGASTLTGVLIGNGTSAVTAVSGTASQLLRRNAGNTAYEFFTFSGMTNPMTTLGDIIYEDATPAPARLAGNITTTKQYLSQTGTGTISAVPAWSTIAGADVTGAALTKTDDTNVTLTLGGTPATSLLRATSLTLGWTGQLAVSRGGTGLSALGTANQLIRVNAGATALEYFTPTYLTSAITSLGGLTASTQTFANDTNVTITSATSTHTLGWSGQLSIARGGTNSTATPTNGGVSYGTGTAYAFTSAGTSGQALVSAGASAPTWTTLTLENLPGAWIKKAVDCATTTALTINTAQTTIDGVTISASSRVLVKDQATASQNGIYTNLTTTSWTRAADADTAGEIAGGMVSVDAGTINGGLTYDTDFKVTDTLGTTSMTWNRVIDTGYTIPTTQGGTGLTTIGSALQVLRVNSGGTALEYATISGSGITSLNGLTGATQTFTNDTNVTITSAGTAHALGWSGSLAVGRGGTGTTTAFTTGSVIFAGASGVYSQNNSNFFWDTTNNRLGLGHATPTTRFHIAGSTTASAGLAKTFLNTSTLVASANNDILIAEEITPTFTLGAFTGVQSIALRIGAGALELQNQNIILNATTGTKIGTATTQKLAFWNKTPVAQPTTAIAASGRVAGAGTNITTTDTFAGYTIQQIVNALITTGILA